MNTWNLLGVPIMAAALASTLVLGTQASLERIGSPAWPLLAISPPESPDSSVPADRGWQDVPWVDGQAVLIVPAGNSDLDCEYLLLSSFGPPTDRVTLQVAAENYVGSPSRTVRRDRWNTLPDSRMIRGRRGEFPGESSAENRQTQRNPQFASLAENVSPQPARLDSEKVVDFLKPGCRGHSPGDFDAVRCAVAWSGRQSRIWYPEDEAHDGRIQRWMEQLGVLMDRELLPAVVADQGKWPDVDRDGIVNLLVTQRAGAIGGEIHAFVRTQDFCRDRSPFSHAPWDVIFLRPGTDLDQLRPILVHELTHVAQFSWCQALCGSQPWPIPDWLTEGLAHAAELRCGTQLENALPRLRTFAQQPTACPLTVTDAATSGLWREPGQRGASAAFCDWWTRQHPDWSWPRLIDSFATSEHPWETVSAANFGELYRHWTIELATVGVAVSHDLVPLPVRTEQVRPGQKLTFTLTGTSTAYLKVAPTESEVTGQVQIQVRGPADAHLQITRVRVPHRR